MYRRLRQLVLSRRLGPDEPLDVQSLAAQLSASSASVYYALTRLVGDELVTRDPERGHVVTPLDVATSDDAHDAKLAIELGVVDLIIGRLTTEQLTRLRELARPPARTSRGPSPTSTLHRGQPWLPPLPDRGDGSGSGRGLRAPQPARPDVACAVVDVEAGRHRSTTTSLWSTRSNGPTCPRPAE